MPKFSAGRSRRMILVVVVVVAGIAGFSAGALTTSFASPNSTLIQACVARTGYVRIVRSPGQCNRREQPLSWARGAVPAQTSWPELCPNCDLRQADLRQALLTQAYLRAVRLDGVNLTASDLTGAKLTHSIISGANFTDAILAGADLSETTGIGVIWSNTICPDETNSDDNGGTCTGHGFSGEAPPP